MDSAYGNIPEVSVLDEVQEDLEIRYEKEFGEELSAEAEDGIGDSVVLYLEPSIRSNSEEHDFLENELEDLTDNKNVNLVYSIETLDGETGYEVFVK